jgi:hypothetical protein
MRERNGLSQDIQRRIAAEMRPDVRSHMHIYESSRSRTANLSDNDSWTVGSSSRAKPR